MGKMLHNEARELLVESYKKTHNAEEIAKIFGVNKYTVYHMAERKRKTGSVALRTSQRGRKQHRPMNRASSVSPNSRLSWLSKKFM